MPRHFKQFSYNFEKYSVKDIVKFIESLGHKIKYQPGKAGEQQRGFLVEHSSLLIRFPFIDTILESNFHPGYSRTGDVLWQNYDSIYYSKGSVERGTYDERNDSLYHEHEVIFNKLKKKFAMKSGEQPKAIKDLDWLKSLK